MAPKQCHFLCMALLILAGSLSTLEARPIFTTSLDKTHNHHHKSQTAGKLDSTAPAPAPETSLLQNTPTTETPAASPNTFSQSKTFGIPGSSSSGDQNPFPMFTPFPGFPSFQLPSVPFPGTATPSLPGAGDGGIPLTPPTTGGEFPPSIPLTPPTTGDFPPGNPFSPPAATGGGEFPPGTGSVSPP